METVELEFLTGKHSLSGAFFDAIDTETYEGSGETEQSQVLRFTLDGQNLEAVEDPSDGYRSDLREVRKVDTAPDTTFPAVEVIGEIRTAPKDEYGGTDRVLQFKHASTGKVVLEIGTTNIDDYYPGFVALFHPENL